MLNVEKIIRVLGYIVYTALWSPFIILTVTVGFITNFAMGIRDGRKLKDCWTLAVTQLKMSFVHDEVFLKTGVWG